MITPACPRALARGPFGMDAFIVLKRLGGGKCSVVFKVMHRASRITVALKAYSREGMHPVHEHQCRREISIHSSCESV